MRRDRLQARRRFWWPRLSATVRPGSGRPKEGVAMDHSFTAEERRLIELWERHMSCEFAERDAAATVATMSHENYVNHVPIMTGGRGLEELLEFYGRHFIPKMPADTQITP